MAIRQNLLIPTFFRKLLLRSIIVDRIKNFSLVLQKRCEELHLQPRGTRGESGGQTGKVLFNIFVDPDSLNLDPDTDPGPAFQVNADPALKRTSSTSKNEIYKLFFLFFC
jgi:hypothetical protein